ncbi:MAG: DUF3810 domain-containing protein [Flavobacteriaceae bacterium]|jgi:hypothetical protein|nr:DUF3810 domain-containing protein [Flavobacteriaceae bacterium]
MKLRFYLLLFIVFQIGLKICSYYPETIEQYYSRGFYPLYSRFWQKVAGSIPFSLGDVFYFAIGVFILYKLIKLYRGSDRWSNRFIVISKFMIKCIIVFFITFNLSWGLNNYRQPLVNTLHLETGYSQEELIAFTKRMIIKANDQQLQLTQDSTKAVLLTQSLELIYNAVDNGHYRAGKETKLYQYTPHTVKSSIYSLPLTYMGFSGYLNPFTQEAQVNDMIPKITLIVTASHEVAHQLGYAHESDANFLGFRAAYAQEQLIYQYGATIFALRYCLNAIDFNENEPMMFEELFQTINPGVQENIMEPTVFWESYKTITDSFFKIFYGTFLKVNNQKEGIRSYNRFVDLLINYNKQYPLY